MIITQTFTMARWQIVVKTSEARKRKKERKRETKMTTKTNKQTKNKTKTTTKREEGAGVEKANN